MTRKWIWLAGVSIAAGAGLAVAPLAAAEWPSVRSSDTLWPTTPLGDAQWPDIPADELAKLSAPATQAAAPAATGAPSVGVASPADTKSSSFLDGLLSRLRIGAVAAAPTSSAKDQTDKNDDLTTGASLDVPRYVPRAAAASFAAHLAPDFTFEGGARYWYSTGTNRFAFTNGIFPFGNPTSTLDWDRMTGHSGEVFGRVDHRPTRLFVKAVGGGGILNGGDIDDLDFLVRGTNFSNTTSAVDGNNLAYAIVDLGYSFEVPSEGIRFGAFVGYHYWQEKMTAFGLLCNADSVNNQVCGGAGSVQIPFNTPVGIFDTTWQAFRVGGDAKIKLYDRWTIAGEIAFVPYAWATNEDSHLLRTDLGPTPNIITHAIHGMGAEAEAFVNYLVLPQLEIGIGVRYWGLFTQSGSVDFGPTFAPDFQLTRLSTQRYGLLLQAKGSF